jgi:hypothetical protein
MVGGEKESCPLLSQERAEDSLRRPDRLPIALQLSRGVPEGIARHQRIIDQAQQRDSIRDQVNGRDNVEQRNDQDCLGLFGHVKIRVSKHFISELQILHIGFQPLPFARQERAPFGAELAEYVRPFGLGLPRAVFENLFDLRRIDRWCSHVFFSLLGRRGVGRAHGALPWVLPRPHLSIVTGSMPPASWPPSS